MSIRALNVLLLVTFAGCFAANAALRADPSVPGWEVLPEMVRMPRHGAFSPNESFPDGKTLRPPVPGTIPVGGPPLAFPATPEGALRAGEELQAPRPPDEAALKRGAAVYASFCRHCHGASGRGDGPVVLRGFPAPPSLFTERATSMKDGQMFHIVTYGQGSMPPHAAQLSAEDRWNVIAHLRSWQRREAAPPPPAPGGER